MVTSVMSIHNVIRVESTIYTKLISVYFTVNSCYYRCTRSCTMPHRGLKTVSWNLEDILNENAYDVQVKCTDDIVTVISDNYIHTHSIYVELVSNAISHLKLDKNDCVDSLSSNNF